MAGRPARSRAHRAGVPRARHRRARLPLPGSGHRSHRRHVGAPRGHAAQPSGRDAPRLCVPAARGRRRAASQRRRLGRSLFHPVWMSSLAVWPTRAAAALRCSCRRARRSTCRCTTPPSAARSTARCASGCISRSRRRRAASARWASHPISRSRRRWRRIRCRSVTGSPKTSCSMACIPICTTAAARRSTPSRSPDSRPKYCSRYRTTGSTGRPSTCCRSRGRCRPARS